MSRKEPYPQDELNPRGIKKLSKDEIAVILRGAEQLTGSAGRTLLARLLKGEPDRELTKRGLDQNPVFGIYEHLGTDDILARIDRVILDGYLEIDYRGRQARLTYTPKGLQLEKETYAIELLDDLDQMLEAGHPPYDMNFLVDQDRDLVLSLLDKVKGSKDSKYIPLLEDWAAVDNRKVRLHIQEVINALRQAG